MAESFDDMLDSYSGSYLTDDFEALSIRDNDPKSSTRNSSHSSRCSSRITQDSVEKMFVNGSFERRNMNRSPSGAKRIIGAKWDEILDNLLKDLNASEKEHPFSVSSYEELVSLQLLEKVPDEVKTKCDIIEEQHGNLFQANLEDVAATYDALPIDTFQRILDKSWTCFVSTEDPLKKRTHEYLIALINVLKFIMDAGSLSSISPPKESLHRAWTEFYRVIFSAVVQGAKTCSDGRRNIVTTGNLLYNGLASFQLITHQDDQTEKSYCGLKKESPLAISVVPDMLPLAVKITFEDSKFISLTEVPAFVVEVKTSCPSLLQWPGWLCASVDGYARECRPEERITPVYKTRRHNINTAMAKLRSQHVLQLLALMKDPRSHKDSRKTLKTSYGLYIFMNRVYVTHLSFDQSLPRYQKDRDLLQAAGQAGMGKYANTNVNMQMFCSDFFDIFNAEHFRAFIAFLKILFWHEHDKNTFQD